MTDEETIARAHRAYSEMGETQAAFAKVRAALIDKLVSTPIDRQDWREKLYLAVQSVDATQKAIREIVDAGQYSASAAGMAGLLAPPYRS